MAKEKPKSIKMFSPRGVFRYPRLGEPDYGNNEYPKPNGEYSVQLVVRKDDPAVKAFIAKLTPLHEQAVKNGKAKFKNLKVDSRKKLQEKNGESGIQINKLYTELFDEETEEPTGEIVFKFAMTASGEYKKGPKAGKRWSRHPDVFDGKRKPMDGKKIWGGSKGIVSFEIGVDKDTEEPGYFIPGTGAVGLKLGLAAAQVIELVQGGSRSAADYGFEEQEDGYEDDGSKVEEETESKSSKGNKNEDSAESSDDSNGGDEEDF